MHIIVSFLGPLLLHGLFPCTSYFIGVLSYVTSIYTLCAHLMYRFLHCPPMASAVGVFFLLPGSTAFSKEILMMVFQ